MTKIKVLKAMPDSLETVVNRWLESEEVEIVHAVQSVVNVDIVLPIFYREIEAKKASAF